MNTLIGLNVFQRLLRRWDLVHPYNAGQVMRVQGTANPARWEMAWRDTLAHHGLGAAIVEGDRYTFDASAESHVQTVPPEIPLDQYLTAALNMRFHDGQVPFRPFIQELDGEFWAGVIYTHWVADSVSIRMLLRDWFLRAMDPQRCRPEPVTIAREGYWPLFGPRRLPWHIDEALLSTLRSFCRFRSVRRLHGVRSDDYAMSFVLRDAPRGLVGPLRAAARNRGVTVNDVFLAAALEQCARLLPLRTTCQRRKIAIGTIVYLRPSARCDLSNTFGMFLGFSNAVASPQELGDFDRLLHTIHLQTHHARRTHAVHAGMVWLYVSMIANRFLLPERSYQFYRKHMPLAGGISNVNLTGSWAAEYHPHLIRQYVRISPTGPMIPVAFTPTSLGDDLHLAMTYRAAVLPHERARQMADGFLARIQQVATG